MSSKNKIIEKIIKIEGGYVNDAQDSGGETKFGITKKVARRFGYRDSMKNLTETLAFDIYVKKYWNAMQLDEIEKITSEKIIEELVDTAINLGINKSSRFLQRCLNALNEREKSYADLKIDGKVGNKTVNALKIFINKRDKIGESVLYSMLNSLQGAFYINLTERRKKDKKFIYGWFKHRIL